MGEVYRATDTRLNRPVAIKVSAHDFNERFEREARAISALNHPNICTLYDVGPSYLVMELVEGETLAKMLERGPLPLDKALQYAVQIVDALAAAHARGVIHRDLKPANIVITKNGVKVLDFGLAKLSAERLLGANAATVAAATSPITSVGTVLGTLYYMAPEQVEAKEADERSDIFSFGVVAYEMVTGQRPFTGDSQASVMAALLKDQPPSISARQPLTPRALDRVIRKCLEKKPDDRWQSARDLKPTLELIDLDAPPSTASTGSVPIPVPTPTRRSWLWPAATGAALVAAAGLAWALWPRPQPTARVTRFEVTLPPGVQIVPANFYVRVSPDGSKVAFTTSGEKAGIWVRDLDAVQARLLAGTEGALAPFWSPDSRSLAYGSVTRLMRVEVNGGPPQVLCESAWPVGSGFWTPQGEIVFGGRGAGVLQRVSAAGGLPTPVTVLANGDTFASLPSPLPDNRHFLYLRASPGAGGLFVGSLDVKPDAQSKQRVALAQFGATFAKTSAPPGGVLFFVRDGTLMAQPFDPKAMSLAGEPVPIVQQIGTGPAHAHFSVTPDGVMAYRTGPGSQIQLAWIDRKGGVLEKVGAPGQPVAVSLSPDEQQLAISRSDAFSNTRADIWLLDLARNVESRFTTGQRATFIQDYGAIWSPDGKQLAYTTVDAVYVKDVGGATDAKLIQKIGSSAVTDWTADGRFLILSVAGTSTGTDVVAVPVQGGGGAAPAVVTGGSLGRISPDGHWIAYASRQSGRSEVYIRPFAEPGGPPAPAGPVIQVSRDGGTAPQWRRNGKELFFRNVAAILSVAIEVSNTTFRPAAPVPLGLTINGPDALWVPSNNSDRFLLGGSLDKGVQTPITVVTNWEATLKR
jgi:Tol biopolymer transport system component